MNMKNEIIDLFSQEDLLRYSLGITVKDPRGITERGDGDGVAGDAFCSFLFFDEYLTPFSVGCEEIVPVIRHTMLKEHWQATAKI